jgi:hypothetical protein
LVIDRSITLKRTFNRFTEKRFMRRRFVIAALICFAGVAIFGSNEKRDRTELGKQVQELGVIPDDKDGFKLLFTDEALKQWRQCGPGRFTVTNGVATGEGGMGLWWYAGRQFTNFILRGEFLQEQEIADSGVFLRFADPKDDPWNAVRHGHEMEIGDPNPKDPTWRTGSIYPFKASIKANTKPVGVWNHYEITCIDQNYSVQMNGESIMTWTDPNQRTRSGYIGLQNYNDEKTVRHRNLRIKDLP